MIEKRLEIELKIKRQIAYIKLFSDYSEIGEIIENKYKEIIYSTNYSQINAELERINNNLEGMVTIIELHRNNNYYYPFDNSMPNISKKLALKIDEVKECIRKIKEEYKDLKQGEKIEKSYTEIIARYEINMNQENKNYETYIKEYVKKSVSENISYSSDSIMEHQTLFDSIKSTCWAELSTVLNSTIEHIYNLEHQDETIEEKEKEISNSIEQIKQKIDYNIQLKFLALKEKYQNDLKNTDTFSNKVTELKDEYINNLIILKEETKMILMYIKNDSIIKEKENELLNKINEINSLLETPLLDEFNTIKKEYSAIYNSMVFVINKETIVKQETYIEKLNEMIQTRLKDFTKQIAQRKTNKKYYDYLRNTNPLYIDFKKLKETKEYFTKNNEEALKELYYQTLFKMILIELKQTKKSIIYETLEPKEKLYIEKMFVQDSKEYEKENFYLEYLRDGLTESVLLQCAEFKIETVDYKKDKIKTIPFATNEEYFNSDEALIKTDEDYYIVNKNGNVIKIQIPNEATKVDYIDKIICYNLYKKIVFVHNSDIQEEEEFYYKERIISNGYYVANASETNIDIRDATKKNQMRARILLYRIKRRCFRPRFHEFETRIISFSDNILLLEKKGNYVFVDLDGNVSKVYNHALSFSDGYALVTKSNGSKQYINTSFKRVLRKFEPMNSFVKGYAKVSKNGMTYYVDQNEKVVETTFVLQKYEDEKVSNYSLCYDGTNYTFQKDYYNLSILIDEAHIDRNNAKKLIKKYNA